MALDTFLLFLLVKFKYGDLKRNVGIVFTPLIIHLVNIN